MHFTPLSGAAALLTAGLVLSATAAHQSPAPTVHIKPADCVVTPRVIVGCEDRTRENFRRDHDRHEEHRRDDRDHRGHLEGAGRDHAGDDHLGDHHDHDGDDLLGGDHHDHDGDDLLDHDNPDHLVGEHDDHKLQHEVCDPSDNFVGREHIERVGHCDVDAEWGGREPMHPFGTGALGGARR